MIAELSGKGHRVCDLLSAARIPSSTYHSNRHRPPKGPTRPELREAVAEVFSQTPNGCGHRQIAMCLRAERGASIADKTVLRMMREMGIRCAIRRERPCRRYSSYRGSVGRTFGNMLGRDFSAEVPWQKMGTGVTEFRQPWGKAYFAPVYDLCTREIVAWSTSESPNMAQQAELLDGLAARMPRGRKTHPPQRHGLAVPARRLVREAQARGHRPEHVEKGKLPGQRLYRGPVRPSQGRVLEGQRVAGLRVVQGRPRLVRPALERKEEAGALGGLTPEEFRKSFGTAA